MYILDSGGDISLDILCGKIAQALIELCMHEMHLSTKRHKMRVSILISANTKLLFEL